MAFFPTETIKYLTHRIVNGQGKNTLNSYQKIELQIFDKLIKFGEKLVSLVYHLP